MRPRYAGVLAQAAALWRQDRDLLARVSAVFFFLPALAFRLFVPPPAPLPEGEAVAPEAAMEATIGWMAANAHWLVGERMIELFGSAVLLALLLDPRRLSLRDALHTALRRYPVFLAVALGTLAAVSLGWMLLVLPGLYVMGRLFLAGPLVMAEREIGPGEALVRAFERSRGLGWLLLSLVLTLFAFGFLWGEFVGGMLLALEGEGVARALSRMIFDMIGAFASAVVGLATVLVQVAVYRQLAPAPRHGV